MLLTLSRLRRLTVRARILILVTLLPAGLLTAGLMATLDARSQAMAERKNAARYVVESAATLVESYAARAARGDLTQEQAQKRAVEAIEAMRYSHYDDGSREYLWINDREPRMIVHPIMPELNGRYVGDFQDSAENRLFAAFVEIVDDRGSGYYRYRWPLPGDPNGREAEKISYVQGIDAWDWIVGSGVYVERINQAAWAFAARFAGVTAALTALFLAGALLIARSITQPLRRAECGVKEMASDLTSSQHLNAHGNDEITTLERGVNQLITALRQSSEETERARRTAERASQAKSEFLSVMSHELRTPLNAMLGFAQLLEREGEISSAQRREHAHHIFRAGSHLHDLLGDILDFGALETEALTLHAEAVVIAALCEESIALLRPVAAERGIELRLSLPERPETLVHGDPVRIKQILSNLILNGIKYNHRGGHVTLRCRATDQAALLEIEDDGDGIAPEMQERIFIAFDRAGRQHGNIPGVGLGLSFSKQLAERMDGDLELSSSTAGRGSTFCLRLPLAAKISGDGQPVTHTAPFTATDHPRADRSDPSPRPISVEGSRTAPKWTARSAPLRVLHIEDQELNRLLVRGLLSKYPTVCLREADTGASGLAALQREKPDVVLLDLHLGDCHGTEILWAIRRDPQLAAIRVIAVTADTRSIDPAAAAAFDAVIGKPLQLTDLEQALIFDTPSIPGR
ncbi:hypothetical protein CKO15_01955 [Halorhodospira abdelmalekii]|uniref:hybrid sensor histidine kinase/response regulator n=1 Tax=Halorhodospira abdelmalekii TaxID=421629 RepID=UPI001908696D|nr:cache domain-containing protein [Halorhodospira abdelmalekii]MBK1734063.1 hypothetical protein [Halorhodospira abdelmalekii]